MSKAFSDADPQLGVIATNPTETVATVAVEIGSWSAKLETPRARDDQRQRQERQWLQVYMRQDRHAMLGSLSEYTLVWMIGVSYSNSTKSMSW